MSVGLTSIVLLIFALGFSIKPLTASQKGISATKDSEKAIKDDCSSTSSQPRFLSSVSLLIKKLLPKRCNSDAEKETKTNKTPGTPVETGGTTPGWKRPKYMHVGYNKKNNKLFKVVGDVDIRDGQDKTNNTLQFQQTINILSNFVKKPEKRHQFLGPVHICEIFHWISIQLHPSKAKTSLKFLKAVHTYHGYPW